MIRSLCRLESFVWRFPEKNAYEETRPRTKPTQPNTQVFMSFVETNIQRKREKKEKLTQRKKTLYVQNHAAQLYFLTAKSSRNRTERNEPGYICLRADCTESFDRKLQSRTIRPDSEFVLTPYSESALHSTRTEALPLCTAVSPSRSLPSPSVASTKSEQCSLQLSSPLYHDHVSPCKLTASMEVTL